MCGPYVESAQPKTEPGSVRRRCHVCCGQVIPCSEPFTYKTMVTISVAAS